MTMNLSLVGAEGVVGEVAWSSTDALLYALSVGAGRDPLHELHLTTENSAGVNQQVLPAYGVVLAMSRGPQLVLGDYQSAQVLHGEQAFTAHMPLPAQGSATATTRCTGIYDKGSAALAVTETTLTDRGSHALLFTSTMTRFIRGEGGFGGPAAPVDPWLEPEGEPTFRIGTEVRDDQALLYRLNGDRNPLHSDPVAARNAGFDRPILHGLCTYGITARLLAEVVCAGDPRHVTAMSGRFSRPVRPGSVLEVQVWVDEFSARYRTVDEEGSVVIDRGTFRWKRGSDDE